ncbi:hypothetical protein LI142_17630 [Eubacterium limosum]|uniref:Uncharacterized protein n=1 Tax=Eubacterium limosum TaxID=1736 RepID=A0ABT5UNT1_EUBLI|nr:hypothetical protein [Eubacterium limosum]MCB6571324.1 hypothetical protein [Eubacterium limosum]MDE1470592.1 hypothetical protein [Eubacterium limosum]
MIPTNYFECWEDYKKSHTTQQEDDEIIGKEWDALNQEMFLFIILNTF